MLVALRNKKSPESPWATKQTERTNMARKLNAALKAKVTPDEALASIIGDRARQRSDILKDLWTYFKKHKLNEGRTIHLDDTLRSSGIWGNKKSIQMTEVGKAMKHASA